MQNPKFKESIFLNGKFLPLDEAKISVIKPGLLSGFGLFETMRSYNDKIVYFNQHLQRVRNSSKLIGMRFPYSVAQLKNIIQRTVKANCLKDAYVRLTLWKASAGTDTLVIARTYKPYPTEKYKTGFSAMISQFRQNENSVLARLKTTSRFLYELSLEEAKQKGFDEAIILNNRGFISEGSRSNIFFVKDGAIFTPSLECGCLDGITRRVIFDLAKKYNLKVCEGNFTVQDLYGADGAFFTNSLMGVMPLKRIEKIRIGKGPKRTTQFFRQKYNWLLYGTKKD